MKKIITYFIDNPLLVNIFVVMLFFGGYISVTSMKKEAYPTVDLRRMVITTVYPGASPLDVELNVTKHLEDEIGSVTGLEKYVSTSAENMSVISVYIDLEAKNPEKIKQDIRSAVDRAKSDFPSGVEEPEIKEIKSDEIPILQYVISSDTLPELTLRKIARDVEDLLEERSFISSVDKYAYRDREFIVRGNSKKMSYKNVSLTDLQTAVANYNLRLGAGRFKSPEKAFSVVTMSLFNDTKEVENVIVRTNFEGQKVRVRDVADVIDSFEERSLYMRGNGTNGILLEIVKNNKADILTAVDDTRITLKKFLKQLRSKYGESLDFIEVYDLSRNTRDMLGITVNNAIVGFCLVFITLVIFLDFKSAFWTAFGLPMAMMVVFITMGFMGININNISLFGIITVLGILVDDGIVLSENIHSKKELGLSAHDAGVIGASEMVVPLVGTISTTILSFMPLAMLGGMVGQFMIELPIVVIIALIGSFLEVFIALPSHLIGHKHLKAKQQGKVHKEKSIESKKWFQALLRGYKNLLKKSLKVRYLVVLIFILMGFAAVKVAKTMNFILFSNDQVKRLFITMEAPNGVNLDGMEKRVEEVEKVLFATIKKEELESIVSKIGNTRTKGDFVPDQENQGVIIINLVPFNRRDRSADDLVKILNKKLDKKHFPKFKKLVVSLDQAGPPVGNPVEVKLLSESTELRKKVGSMVKDFLKTQKGVYGIEDDSDNLKKEIHITFDYDKMYRLGITPSTVSNAAKMAFDGLVVSSIPKNPEDIDVRVTLRDEDKINVDQLKKLLIPTSYGKQVHLEQVASFPEKMAPNAYYHYNGVRTTTISSQLNIEVNNSQKVSIALIKKFRPIMAKYTGIRMKISGEGEETEKTLGSSKTAFLFTIVGIFVVLLLIFKTVTQPLMVITAIPFGFIGIIFSFKAHGVPLGFFALIGGIGLAGVVVNASIVMVDYINQLIKNDEGDSNSFKEHVIEGAGSRLRPIVLTTITTVAGLFPSVYGIGGSNPMIRPLAMAMAYGLIFGTAITLFLIPSLYLIDKDARSLVSRIKNGLHKIISKILGKKTSESES